MNYPTCLLCGIQGPQVRMSLVEWREPEPKRFDSITLCTNRAECRQRVEQAGDDWPLVGGTTTRIEDWAAIAAEYARLAPVPANPEGEPSHDPDDYLRGDHELWPGEGD